MKWPPSRRSEGGHLVCAVGRLHSSGLGIVGIELRDVDLLCQSELAQQPDAVVVDVELVPGQAVACADGVSVVVVVPALAAGQSCYPPVVARVVAGLEAASAP